jgi:hypothetical protein
MEHVAITSGHLLILMEIGNHDAQTSMRTLTYVPGNANQQAEIRLTGTSQERWQVRM